MSSPQYENDKLLEELLHGKSETTADSHQVMKSLVSHYQAKPMPSALKQKIWQQLQAEQSKTRKPAFNWKWALVASFILVIGFILIANLRLNEIGFAMLQSNEAATEIVLDSPALFSDMPEISPAFGFEYGGYTRIDELDNNGSMMQNANMQWVAIYATHDSYRPEEIVAQIEVAHLNGFKILVSVSGPEGLTHFKVDEYPAFYADFVGQIAAAGADAIEIWPEANLDRSMPQWVLGAETYALILGQASAAIRENNPDTLIISGAPVPTGAEAAYPREVINDDNFLRQLMDLGALDTVDCVGLRYTEGIVPPLAISADSRDDYYTRYLPTMLQTYREIVEARIPICITSIGYLSLEGMEDVPNYLDWAENTSREEQEQWLGAAMEWLSLQTDVRLALIWHIDYVDNENTAEEFQGLWQGYSLISPSDN